MRKWLRYRNVIERNALDAEGYYFDFSWRYSVSHDQKLAFF